VIGAITAGLYGIGVPAVTNSYESIATVTVGTATPTISFSSIPSTYKHLQLRGIVRGGGESAVFATFNSNGGNGHALYANGTIAGSYRETGGMMVSITPTGGSGADVYAATVTDILDYQDTNKYKTVRSLTGTEKDIAGGNPYIFLQSSLWQYTAAVSSISLTIAGGSNFAVDTQFALYGIRG
jgi:hypothetical protein